MPGSKTRDWALVALMGGLVAGLPAAAAAGASGSGPVLAAGPVALLGSGPDLLDVGLGAWEAFQDDRSVAGSIEYRFGRKLLGIGPALGLIANVDGGLYGYFAIYADIALGPVVVTPALGVGGARTGDSVDLGGTLEFREQVEVAWRFQRGYRLGLRIGHISNAGIYDTNPGENDLMITFGVPLGPLF